MNEIVQLLQDKVGLNQEQAQAVVQVLASHLQSRLPVSLQGAVLPLLGLQGDAQAAGGESGGLGGLMGEVSSLFGNKG